MKCIVCKKQFICVIEGGYKYCSIKCARQLEYKNHKKYWDRNKNKINKKRRKK